MPATRSHHCEWVCTLHIRAYKTGHHCGWGCTSHIHACNPITSLWAGLYFTHPCLQPDHITVGRVVLYTSMPATRLHHCGQGCTLHIRACNPITSLWVGLYFTHPCLQNRSSLWVGLYFTHPCLQTGHHCGWGCTFYTSVPANWSSLWVGLHFLHIRACKLVITVDGVALFTHP